VYAVPDLAAGVAAMEERLGARTSPGGSHPGLGTANRLLALGPDVYLEVIGPDPDQGEPDAPRPFGIDALERGRLATWSARVEGTLEDAVAAARAAGVDPGDVRGMERRRPDGTLLAWRMTPLRANLGDGLVPFLIDWGATPHPAASAAPGGRLVGLRGEHPDPAAVRAQLAALGLAMGVEPGPAPRLVATLETAGGPLELD
jgi:hypothetical protein